MYSRIVRDQAYEKRLAGFLRDTYGLPVATIQPAPRGFFAETWQATTTTGGRYFVKANYSPTHQTRFEASLPVVDHLNRQPDRSQFHITHGDAGGNLMVDGSRYAIVDWDEVKYAPPERDAWVMCCRDRPKRQWAADKPCRQRGQVSSSVPEGPQTTEPRADALARVPRRLKSVDERSEEHQMFDVPTPSCSMRSQSIWAGSTSLRPS